MDAFKRFLSSAGAGVSGAEPDQQLVESRRYWMPDSVSVNCYECSAKFGTFRRRHHCRVCGQIFCSKCCDIFIKGETIGFKEGEKVHEASVQSTVHAKTKRIDYLVKLVTPVFES